MHILINKKYLTYKDYKVKCAIGKRGINLKKKEGDLITPKGLYKIKYILYRKDRVKILKSKLKKIIIRKNMGWCDDSRSNKYNKLINLPFKYRSEKLFKRENIYDIVLVLNYNMNPIIKNKGSAIFIHCSFSDNRNTAGCVALKRKNLIYLIKKIKDNTHIKI